MFYMKKLWGVIAFLAITLIGTGSMVRAETTNIMRPDIVCFGGQSGNPAFSTSAPFCIDFDGNFILSKNQQYSLGQATAAFKSGNFGNIFVDSGIVNQHETFIDLASGTLSGCFNQAVTTATLTSGGSSYVTPNFFITQPTGAPRNLTVYIASSVASDSGANDISTATFIGAATFYGIDAKGNQVWELIRFSTNTISQSSAAVDNSGNPFTTRGYFGVGNIAFAQVSSFTVQVTSMTNDYGLQLGQPVVKIGFGQKIGLANNIIASGDVYKVVQQNGDVTIAANNTRLTIDTVYDTIVFQSLPNTVMDYNVWYKVKRMWPE